MKLRPLTILTYFAMLCGILGTQGCTSSQTSPSPTAEALAQTMLKSIRPGDLVRAAASGDEEKVRQLLRSGADVNETLMVTVPAHANVPPHQEAITPLLAAVANDYARIVSLLINFQAKSPAAFQPTFQGYTAKDFLHYRGQNSTACLLR
jgi:hypothetical protein